MIPLETSSDFYRLHCVLGMLATLLNGQYPTQDKFLCVGFPSDHDADRFGALGNLSWNMGW